MCRRTYLSRGQRVRPRGLWILGLITTHREETTEAAEERDYNRGKVSQSHGHSWAEKGTGQVGIPMYKSVLSFLDSRLRDQVESVDDSGAPIPTAGKQGDTAGSGPGLSASSVWREP